MALQIKKRNGVVVEFNAQKIRNAIFKANAVSYTHLVLKTWWKQWRNAGCSLFKVGKKPIYKMLCKRINEMVKTMRKVFLALKRKKSKLSTFPQMNP